MHIQHGYRGQRAAYLGDLADRLNDGLPEHERDAAGLAPDGASEIDEQVEDLMRSEGDVREALHELADSDIPEFFEAAAIGDEAQAGHALIKRLRAYFRSKAEREQLPT